MATITYGKGNVLQPTSLKALRATLDQNARDGRIEMPDESPAAADGPVPGGFVRVTVSPADARHVKYTFAVNPRIIAKGIEDKRSGYRARRTSAAQEKKEVRVVLNAPDLVEFFSSKSKKTHSY